MSQLFFSGENQSLRFFLYFIIYNQLISAMLLCIMLRWRRADLSRTLNVPSEASLIVKPRKNDIERAVAHILSEYINDPTLRIIIAEKVYDYYMREFGSDDSYEKSLVANIKDIEVKLGNYAKAIEMGIFNETTQERMQELEERKRLYNDELTAEKNRQKYALKKEHVVRYLECFVGNLNEPSLRDKVLDYLVEKIYIYNDKFIVNFYYSDDNQEVNLKEFNEYLDNLDNIMEFIDAPREITDVSEEFRKTLESMIAKDEDEESF